MYTIWKIRCECTISWNNDPTKSHSTHEIHNKWLQAINARLKMDSVQKNTKIFKKKTLGPKTVLRTWKNCLKDNLHEKRNWCGKTGVCGYSAEETSGSQQVTPTGAPGTSPTHSHRLVRKSISSGCHIETPTSLTYDQAFELHQKKKKTAPDRMTIPKAGLIDLSSQRVTHGDKARTASIEILK